jgi:hypothetical protein
MALSTTNYFDRVRGVDFAKLPETLRKGHDLVKKVSPDNWGYYHQSEPLRRVTDQYFEKLDAYLAQHAPKPKAAPKAKAPVTKPLKAAAKKAPSASTKKATGSATKAAAPKAVKAAPEGPKRTKVKKHGNQNLRQPVAHFDGDLTLIRQFLSLTKGEVTRKRVKALHGRIEKAIVSRKVRKTSPHAALLTDIAGLVKKTYAAMVEKNIEKVGELKFSDKGIVGRARAVADQVEIQSSVPLLSRFINLQGTKPEAKTVATLLKAMEKQRRDVPGDDYAGPLSAAVALLKDWKPGTAVRITQHQLSGLAGLAGLGCPGDTCGCAAGK